MNRRIILGLILTMSLSLASLPVSALNANVVNNAPKQSIVLNKINFEVVSEKDTPRILMEMVNENKDKKGFVFTVDDSTGYIYIAAMSGTKPTVGYSIEVIGVEDNEGKTNVFVKELIPPKEMMVAQVITHPYTIVRAKGITPNITVKNLQQENFNNLTINPLALNIKNKNWKDIKNYTNVAEDKEWTIKFNISIKNLIINSDTVYILDSLGNKVQVALNVSSDKTYAKVIPITNYDSSEIYYLFISKNIIGEGKNKSIIEGYRMRFKIRDAVIVE
ncbi:protease complex subunit PrcB family protein [Clostridium estertheticum]|uniref:protease complex subunit PrcB family protein n=1 Tax=Clostridium estertheticum TaxID=238834 RepID=UPI0013E9204E|nr:protease complex subunit PrcB family protein [Clostridium estertheticum]MBZ9687686.1 protease complex subunit PrcB family protein [Clostridium estertheticum]